MRAVSASTSLYEPSRKRRSALLFSALLLLSSYAALEFGAWEARASTDADGAGLT